MPRLTMGKMRPPEEPYLIVHDEDGAFGPTTFKVLKAYQQNPDQKYARVLVQAISPATGSSGDFGDAYWGDVTGTITFRDPIVTDDDIPSHLKGGPKEASTLEIVLKGWGL